MIDLIMSHRTNGTNDFAQDEFISPLNVQIYTGLNTVDNRIKLSLNYQSLFVT